MKVARPASAPETAGGFVSRRADPGSLLRVAFHAAIIPDPRLTMQGAAEIFPLARVREGDPNDKMLSMMHLDNPMLDWVKLAEGRGGPATRATTAEEFHHQFEAAMSTKGPRLIEARIVQNLVGADTRRETVSDLLYEVKGRVAIITLNRPEKLNAFTGSMIEARPTDTRAWRTSRLLRCCMKGPLHLEGP